MAEEFLRDNPDDDPTVTRLVTQLQKREEREEAVRRSLKEGVARIRLLMPSFVGVVRLVVVLSGLAASVAGAYAHFIAPLGMVAPPLRSLALLFFGLVAVAFGFALREARE
ncbi:hypothetical protein D6792_03210 [Candidatus Parcubacteria bacterium]|nr:MAG: hypothetical protein D6792_03210 [Candidatus Parcubacteria bacterium]GIW68803.1 MAG: hypothetical protein KatS3mg100_297 [Candidatus Parcubacteria bacterium]